MVDLSKLFDKYSLGARVKPSFLLFLPVVIIVFAIFEPARSVGGAVLTFLSSFGVIAFGANQMSSQGNKLQDRLFEKWGGAPTTLIMRPRSPKLDKHTRERYCRKLAKMIPDFQVISDEQALAEREKTRDPKKHSLILNENIEYGFSRNLRACKPAGVFITIACCALSLTLLWVQLPEQGLLTQLATWKSVPIPYYILVGLNLLILWSWIVLVTEEWVKIRGYAYAQRLYAACEEIQ